MLTILMKSNTIARAGQQVQPAFVDVNAELRIGRQLLKHKHPLSTNPHTQLKKLAPTSLHTQLKKWLTTISLIQLKKLPTISPHTQLKKLPTTKNKLSITYHTLMKLQKPPTTHYIWLSTVSLT